VHFVRVLGRRLTFVLAVPLALSFVGTSMAAGPVAGARSDPSSSAARADAMIEAARQYIGRPYRLGTEGPDSFDCSGLVFRSFADAGELSQIGGSRRLAAAYRRWFASKGLFTADEGEARRGDLVMYGGGEHIGIFLGDRKVLSALVTGVTVHSLDGISVEVTGFLKVDWSGKREQSSPDINTDQRTGTDVEEPEVAPLPEEPPNLGLPSYNPFERFEIGGDTLAVNVATGNVVFSHPVVSLPVGDGASELALTYNSQSAVDSGFGPGWRLNAMRGLAEKNNGDVVFTAGDGSWHTFTEPTTDGTVTTYSRPVTLYATLRRDTSQTPEWTLTYRDESVDYFATRGSDGVLARTVDPLGSAIDFSYGARSQLLKRATDSDGRHADFGWDRDASPARLVSISEWVDADGAALDRAAETTPPQYKFAYDTDGYLIGLGNRLDTEGSCPKPSEHRTCLGYEAGRLATVKPALAVDGAEPTHDARGASVTTWIEYDEETAEVTEVRGTGYTEADEDGVTFERIAPDKLRVVRAGPSPVTTRYRLVSAADPLGRVRSVARNAGSGMTVEQRTDWDADQPTEPARVKTSAGTITYHYVADSMGLVSHTTNSEAAPQGGSAPRGMTP